jgi:serine phosphatase RsbU (regulator of sigma subunit)
MIALLNLLQRKIRPDLNNISASNRYLMMSNVVGVFYSIPLILFGLIWLVNNTPWEQFILDWHGLVVVFVALVIFSRLRLFMTHPLPGGHMVGSDADFAGMILWAGMLIFGLVVIWLNLLWISAELGIAWHRANNQNMRWDAVRSACLNLSSLLIASLLSLTLYRNLNGQLPIAGLTPQSFLPAMLAVLCYALVYFVIWLPFILYVLWVQASKFDLENIMGLLGFTIGTMELPFVSLPFGVMASGLYIEHGVFILGIYSFSLFLIALLADRLSRSAAKSHRQTVQLMGLEKLGRDILAAPTDARNLPGLLQKHIPDMFSCRRAVVWLAPETYLLVYPDGRDNLTPEIWTWLLKQSEPEGFLRDTPLPWENAPERHLTLLTAPILDPISSEAIGGLFIELLSLPQNWNRETLQEHYPALQNLAAQIATALKQADVYQETLRHQRVSQELRLAGEIQSSFLPESAPDIPGWDIAASLKPARQTSGDFYDFFMLEDDRVGIVIADVADKGLGAALYMALGRTLLLTYAQEYPENPAAVLHATNQRMLSDARARMFITAFYGVLEPRLGRLIYCNAGHHPPILISNRDRGNPCPLNPNGMALGIDAHASWVAVSQRIEAEDTLLLYTDGIVEANNSSGAFYGMERLLETAKLVSNRPSQWIIRAIQDDLLDFQGDLTQSDDITLVCIRHRE